VAFEFQAGSIFAELQLDATKFKASVDQVVQSAKEMAKKTETALATGSGGKGVFGGILTGAKEVVGHIGTIFGGLGTIFKSVMAPINWVIEKFTSLKTLLIGFAAYKFFERAAEVEAMAVGFRTLTASIGITSDSLLGKLRAAMRGSVSDFELMQLTNKAIQVDLVKSEEQFVALAEAAHELGEAVGVDAAHALEVLTTGLAYGSGRPLRALGLKVDEQEAVARYALQMGKFGKELSNAEQKAGFLAAVLEEVDRKVKTLSAGAPMQLKGFEQLRVAITNVIDTVAVRVSVPFAAIAKTISDFLDQNRGRIAEFAKAVGDYIQSIVARFAAVFREWSTGGMSIASMIGHVSGIVVDEVGKLIDAAIEKVKTSLEAAKPNIKKMLGDFADAMMPEISDAISAAWDEFGVSLYENVMPWIPGGQLATEDWLAEAQKRLRARNERLHPTFKGENKLTAEQLAEVNARFDAAQKPGLGVAAPTSTASKPWVPGPEMFLEGQLEDFDTAFKKASEMFSGWIDDAQQKAYTVGSKVGGFFTGIIDTQMTKARGVWEVLTGESSKGLKSAEDKLRPFIAEADLLEKTLKGGLGSTEAAQKMAQFEEVVKEIQATFGDMSSKDLTLLNAKIDETRIKLSKGLEGKALSEATKKWIEEQSQLQGTVNDFWRSDTNKKLAEIERERQANVRGGMPPEFAAEVAQQKAMLARELASLELTKTVTSTVSDSLLKGLADGFMRGERLGKAWTQAVGAMFTQALSNAVSEVSKWASNVLGDALSSIGKQLGLNFGMGGLATGVLAIGAIIWQTAQASKTATIEDFTSAINSSEAVRGVVAGPSNVAISKVGESLSTALIPTNRILNDILTAIVRGGGVAGSTTSGRSSVLGMTPSTI
jgi:hypothetical protein